MPEAAQRKVAPRILYVQYTNPAGYPPLQHSSRILADAGWQVLFLGTGALGADKLRFPPHPNITVRQMAFCPAGWRQKLHYLLFSLCVLVRALWQRPRWVYASDLLSCPVALVLTLLPGTQVIYHEHDSPVPLPHNDEGDPARPENRSRFERFLLWTRRALARRARRCVIPSAERARHFRAEMGDGVPVTCAWNCPSRTDVDTLLPSRKGAGLSLWYHGSIVPSQLPEAAVQALALLPAAVKLKVAGYETVGHRGYMSHLQELARKLGVGDRLDYLGTTVERGELLRECSKAHVGISLFARPTRQPMVGASNKPFDYLACGLALLVSDLPDWREFYVQPGYGLACDPEDAVSIAMALRWYLDHPEEALAMGERGRQRILREWNYEQQFGPVLGVLDGQAHELSTGQVVSGMSQ